MVKKRAIALLTNMKEYQEIVMFLKKNKTITASNLESNNLSKIKAAYRLKHMYDMELLNRKKEKDTWVYRLPAEIHNTTYEWEENYSNPLEENK